MGSPEDREESSTSKAYGNIDEVVVRLRGDSGVRYSIWQDSTEGFELIPFERRWSRLHRTPCWAKNVLVYWHSVPY